MTLTPATSRFSEGQLLGATAFTANVACSNTSAATATVVVTAPAIVFDGATAVTIEFYAPSFNGSLTTIDCNLSLYEDGADIGQVFSGRSEVAAAASDSMYVMHRKTPTAGSHTYSIRGWVSAAGTLTVVAGAGGAGVLMPGFIRVVKE